ncbi:MAG: DUF1882 domain-containing protein [Helicobacteraceae bacterium]|jgi:hypothetical protein|nr:DUF1882 domain-containing protein [Helicobacteraceae bacterium]
MLQPLDLKLIKMQTSHYFRRRTGMAQTKTYLGKMYFDKFERVDEPLNMNIVNAHLSKTIVAAHNLILPGDKVENIVFDYNGIDPQRFYHRAQLLFREEGFLNFTAYKSQTDGHLHLYIHKGHTTFKEGSQLAKSLSAKLAQRLPIQWRVFPSVELPAEFNVLVLPYEVYEKERGTGWSKHL